MRRLGFKLAAGLFCGVMMSAAGMAQQLGGGSVAGDVNTSEMELIPVSQPIEVTPVAIARLDEEGFAFEGWQPWPEQMPVDFCSAFYCFDGFEMDSRTDRPGDGFYGLDCGLGAGRYRFADNTRNCMFVDDIDRMVGAVAGACNGVRIGRVLFGWYWHVNGANSSERCVISFTILENWEDSGNCTSSGFVSSIAVDFGVLPSNVDTGGYYFADLPLCLLQGNLRLDTPADGRGAYKVVLAKDANLTPATMAQPMYWGTQKPLNEANQLRRTFWDLNFNGIVNGGECRALDVGQCMNPLGTMIAFGYQGSPSVPKLRASCDERGRLTARVKNYERDERVQLKYDGGNTNPLVANNKGKGKVRWTGVAVGSHTVEASSDRTWTIYRNTSCPPR